MAKLNLDELLQPPPGVVPGSMEWSRWLAAMVCSVFARAEIIAVGWRTDQVTQETKLCVTLREDESGLRGKVP